jgi:hypothetical protein
MGEFLKFVEDELAQTNASNTMRMGDAAVDVPDRKVGEWTEKEVIYAEEAKTAIEEWQSCRCSVCGRYDTRPYMYYFNNPNYCSWCGAEMKGEEE